MEAANELSNVDSVISHLPHLPNGEDIVYIQQPESTGHQSNGTAQETPYHSCRYSKVMQALQLLKQNNPFYCDVTIANAREDMFNGDGHSTLVTDDESNV